MESTSSPALDGGRVSVSDPTSGTAAEALAGKRVLFISVSYRPEHTGIGPYAAATAEHLAARGAEVTVLAGLPHYPSWRLSRADQRRLRRDERVGGVRVVRLRQLIPRRHSVVSRLLYELSFLTHGLLARRTWETPDVVVAVTPSLSGALVGKATALRHGRPLVVIVQDLTTAAVAQSGMRGGSLTATLLGGVEARLLRSAEMVGLAHRTFRSACVRMGVDERQLQLVPNWSLRTLPNAGSPAAAPMPEWKDRFVVLHAGNMGFKQGLEVVLEAARLAGQRGETDLLFVLMGDGNRRDVLTRLARDLPNVCLVDPVTDADFPGFLAAADVLLVTQRQQVVDMSVPSKLTAYFTAGRPVVCAAAADSGTAAEVARSGGGVVVPVEASALLDALLSLRRSPDLASRLGAAGQSYSRDYLSSDSGLGRVAALVCAGLDSGASR